MSDAIKLAIEALEVACGNRCNAEYNPCQAREALAALRAQPDHSELVKDAARYRWLRSTTNWASNSSNERIDVRNSPELWDAAIDAAINAKEQPNG